MPLGECGTQPALWDEHSGRYGAAQIADMSDDGQETGRISFTGRWDFVVRDEADFLAYVTERVRQKLGDAAANDPEHLGDVNSALDTLL